MRISSDNPKNAAGTKRILDIILALVCLLPAALFLFLFPKQPFDLVQGFDFLRIGLVLVSFMLYMMTKYLVGFLRMTSLPKPFRQALRTIGVLAMVVVGALAVAYGRWWLEYLPHGMIAVYTLWRVKA